MHLNIEARLTALVGDAGKRLHTGRSRNDQVATDVRLWLRDEIDLIVGAAQALQRALVEVAEETTSKSSCPASPTCKWPSPSALRHHLLAYVEMFERDAERMLDVRKRVNVLPLGSAALAGTTYPLDRRARGPHPGHGGRVPEQPGRRVRPRLRHRIFRRRLSGDGAHLAPVRRADRVDEPELWLHQDCRPLHHRLRRIMPQKKNPDVPELARGKTGRVVGHLMGLITLMKGQPLAYNKDNQEDKEPLLDTVDTLKDTLRIFAEMIGGQINPATRRQEVASP